MKEIIEIIKQLNKKSEIETFFDEMFTKKELEKLQKRWRILNMLTQGKTQRQIANELNVSLCKVTRGAKILKDKNAVVSKFLIKETKNVK